MIPQALLHLVLSATRLGRVHVSWVWLSHVQYISVSRSLVCVPGQTRNVTLELSSGISLAKISTPCFPIQQVRSPPADALTSDTQLFPSQERRNRTAVRALYTFISLIVPSLLFISLDICSKISFLKHVSATLQDQQPHTFHLSTALQTKLTSPTTT